ncbi:putative Dioxygenase [Alphaproteobacteria bacterium]
MLCGDVKNEKIGFCRELHVQLRFTFFVVIAVFLLFCVNFSPFLAQAEGLDGGVVAGCLPTPGIWGLSAKPAIYSTNNLVRKVGSAKFAKGRFIRIRGRVLDSRCVPVGRAVVQIWQADARGYYGFGAVGEATYLNDRLLYGSSIYSTEKTVTDESQDRNEASVVDQNFTGSGCAVTDNLGYYSFFTIMPGTRGDEQVPKVHMHVSHCDFDPLETQMFFPQYKNYSDQVLECAANNELLRGLLIASAEKQGALGQSVATEVYNFNIVLNGVNKYKEY